MKEIGKNIKILRNEAGISIRELAEKVGISHNTLAAYERSVVVPTVPNAVKISEYFKVPVEVLVYGKTVIKQDFKDNKLLSLAKQVDEIGDKEVLQLAKKYLRKLIKNYEERMRLVDEAEGG